MTPTSDAALLDLQKACEAVKSAASGSLTWEWDSRFGAALASFDKDLERDVLTALDDVFDRVWSAAEVAAGPKQVAQFVAKLGGLRSGQMLLTAFADGTKPILFCAWWPWGSGARISIRIGSVDELASSVRTWFGV